MLLVILLLTSYVSPAQPVPRPGRGLRFHPFQPAPEFRPTAINDKGEIVGNHDRFGAVLVRADGTLQVLGFDGLVSAWNNRGQMLVNVRNVDYADNQLFLRHPDGTMEPRTFAGARDIAGYGINNLGQIAGSADGEAVVWDPVGAGRVISIPSCRPGPAGRGRALAINDKGELIVETECSGTFSLKRTTLGGRFISSASTKYRGVVGLSNNGDFSYSAARFAVGRETALLDAADRPLHRPQTTLPSGICRLSRIRFRCLRSARTDRCSLAHDFSRRHVRSR